MAMFNVPSSLRCTRNVMFYSPVAGAYCNKGVSVVQTEGQSPGPTSAAEGPALLCELPGGNGLSAFMSSLSGSCELSFFFRSCQTNARPRRTGGAHAVAPVAPVAPGDAGCQLMAGRALSKSGPGFETAPVSGCPRSGSGKAQVRALARSPSAICMRGVARSRYPG